MLETVSSIVAMVFFGIVTGVLVGLHGILSRQRRQMSKSRRAGESYWDMVNRMAQEGTEVARSMPRSYRVVLFAFYAVIAILVLSVILSPLQMVWAIFLPSLLAGFMLVRYVFTLARKGKVRVRNQGFLDIAPSRPSSDLGS